MNTKSLNDVITLTNLNTDNIATLSGDHIADVNYLQGQIDDLDTNKAVLSYTIDPSGGGDFLTLNEAFSWFENTAVFDRFSQRIRFVLSSHTHSITADLPIINKAGDLIIAGSGRETSIIQGNNADIFDFDPEHESKYYFRDFTITNGGDAFDIKSSGFFHIYNVDAIDCNSFIKSYWGSYFLVDTVTCTYTEASSGNIVDAVRVWGPTTECKIVNSLFDGANTAVGSTAIGSEDQSLLSLGGSNQVIIRNWSTGIILDGDTTVIAQDGEVVFSGNTVNFESSLGPLTNGVRDEYGNMYSTRSAWTDSVGKTYVDNTFLTLTQANYSLNGTKQSYGLGSGADGVVSNTTDLFTIQGREGESRNVFAIREPNSIDGNDNVVWSIRPRGAISYTNYSYDHAHRWFTGNGPGNGSFVYAKNYLPDWDGRFIEFETNNNYGTEDLFQMTTNSSSGEFIGNFLNFKNQLANVFTVDYAGNIFSPTTTSLQNQINDITTSKAVLRYTVGPSVSADYATIEDAVDWFENTAIFDRFAQEIQFDLESGTHVITGGTQVFNKAGDMTITGTGVGTCTIQLSGSADGFRLQPTDPSRYQFRGFTIQDFVLGQEIFGIDEPCTVHISNVNMIDGNRVADIWCPATVLFDNCNMTYTSLMSGTHVRTVEIGHGANVKFINCTLNGNGIAGGEAIGAYNNSRVLLSDCTVQNYPLHSTGHGALHVDDGAELLERSSVFVGNAKDATYTMGQRQADSSIIVNSGWPSDIAPAHWFNYSLNGIQRSYGLGSGVDGIVSDTTDLVTIQGREGEDRNVFSIREPNSIDGLNKQILGIRPRGNLRIDNYSNDTALEVYNARRPNRTVARFQQNDTDTVVTGDVVDIRAFSNGYYDGNCISCYVYAPSADGFRGNIIKAYSFEKGDLFKVDGNGHIMQASEYGLQRPIVIPDTGSTNVLVTLSGGNTEGLAFLEMSQDTYNSFSNFLVCSSETDEKFRVTTNGNLTAKTVRGSMTTSLGVSGTTHQINFSAGDLHYIELVDNLTNLTYSGYLNEPGRTGIVQIYDVNGGGYTVSYIAGDWPNGQPSLGTQPYDVNVLRYTILNHNKVFWEFLYTYNWD